MEFNIQEFLSKNKLTGQSQMREEDNTELVLSTNDEEGSDSEEQEPEDTWNKPEPDDSAQYEKEPTKKDIGQAEPELSGIHKKQAQLQSLEAQKDMLLMQLKGDVINLDQYKQAIGNIPNQIKKLRADVAQAMNVSLDSDSEEEMA
jgi:hypothetical protein